MTTAYAKFAKYYDSFVEAPTSKVKLINTWVKAYFPDSITILEIACGTGSVLKELDNKYKKSGLDISKQMLSVAKQKLPQAIFYQHDMRNFNLMKKYDVILCIYDSINHLVLFEDWKKVFKNVQEHLNTDGLFIFDLLTQQDFEEHAGDPSVSVREFHNDVVLETIQKTSPNSIRTHTRIFEHVKNNQYKFFEEKLDEVTFDIDLVKKILLQYFDILKIVDPIRSAPSEKSKVLYFVCKKK